VYPFTLQVTGIKTNNGPAEICLCERRVQADYKTKKERDISEYLPLFFARPFS